MRITEEIFITNGFEETQKLGKEFIIRILLVASKSLSLQGVSLSNKNTATVVALYGDLGSGKTTFVQGMARGLGIERRIISPTFVLVREHRIMNHESGIKNFYHIDLYRIESHGDVKGLGIEEIIEDPQNIVAIEWAEKLGDMLPEKRWDVKLEYLDEDKRKITIKSSKLNF